MQQGEHGIASEKSPNDGVIHASLVDLPVETGHTTGELLRLQTCINDLVSVLASPVMRDGYESSRIATTLVNVLVRMLRLDFAYLRAADVGEGSPQAWLRSADHTTDHQKYQIDRVVAAHANNHVPGACARIDNPLGPGTVSMIGFD